MGNGKQSPTFRCLLQSNLVGLLGSKHHSSLGTARSFRRPESSDSVRYQTNTCLEDEKNRFLCYIIYLFISFCCGRYRICGWYQETRAGGGGVCESNYPRSRGLGSTHYHNTAGVKALVDPNTLLNIIISIYTSKLRL